MYTPLPNREKRLPLIHSLLREYPFGLLLTVADGVTHTTHLPFVLDESQGEKGTLYFHIARANGHRRALSNAPSIAVFQGPHAYVSPGWYLETRSVPTWNYAVVHLHGTAQVLDDEEARARLAELVARHEVPGGWSFDAHTEEVGAEFPGIVAYSMPLQRVDAKFKLSQNLPPGDRAAVIARLAAADDPGSQAVAALMQKTAGFES